MRSSIIALLAVGVGITLAGVRASGDTRGTELIGQARAALGGEAALSKVVGLSCAGTVQRMIGDRRVDGELTLDLQLPDKMWRTDSISPMGDGTLVITGQGVNGDTPLRSMRTQNAPPGAVIRTPPPPAPGSDAEAQAVRNSKAELARLTVALLVASPASMSLEFTAAGQAEAPDGGRADVVDVKGPGNFAARLFLDASSHRPLMLTYRGVAPRLIVRTERGPGSPEGPASERAQRPPEVPKGDVVEMTMFLDDYRSVDGILLPHHLTRSVDDKPTEEWTFKTIKVNPAFAPDAFSGK